MRTYQAPRQEESFLDTIREAVYQALPHYDLALSNPDGSTKTYSTSPLETLAVFMSKGNGSDRKSHGHLHQAPKTITVKAHGREVHVDRHAHEGKGICLAEYIARTLGISRKQATQAIRNSQ